MRYYIAPASYLAPRHKKMPKIRVQRQAMARRDLQERASHKPEKPGPWRDRHGNGRFLSKHRPLGPLEGRSLRFWRTHLRRH